jgi:trigger factor
MYLTAEKKQEIFAKYGKSSTDTGSPEAQIALFTYRINHLTEHLKRNKKDKIKYYQITPDDTMIENQVKSYAGRFGKYEQEETVEEQDMLKGLLVELENGEEKADGIRVENAVLTPAYMKDEAIKTVFVGAKKEGEVIFNPKQAYENEAEVASLLKMKKEEVENLTSDFKYTIQSITRYHEATFLRRWA